jgi:cytoskeletal protein CcmA (bactofilin family)
LPGPMRRRALRALPPALLLLLVTAQAAVAADYRTGDTVTVGRDESFDEDLYVAAGTITFDGRVDGDLTVAGGTVTVNGEVTGSINVASGQFTLNGTSGGAVRSAGGEVTITGSVGRDLVVVGGDTRVTEQGSVAGDVAGATGSLSLLGTVGGDVESASGTMRIGGRVDGSVDVEVEQLVILSGAVIGGDVRYGSSEEAQVAADAQIGGEIERREPASADIEGAGPDNPLIQFLAGFFGLLLLGWLIMLIRPRPTALAGAELRARPLLGLGIGLAGWIVQFLLLILLILLAALFGQLASSLGGAFIGLFIVVLLAVILLALVAHVYVAMAIGDLIGGFVSPRPAVATRGPAGETYVDESAAAPSAASPWLLYAVGALIWSGLLALAGLVSGGLLVILYLLGWVLGIGALALYHWSRRRVEGQVVVVREPIGPERPAPA